VFYVSGPMSAIADRNGGVVDLICPSTDIPNNNLPIFPRRTFNAMLGSFYCRVGDNQCRWSADQCLQLQTAMEGLMSVICPSTDIPIDIPTDIPIDIPTEIPTDFPSTHF
jgi:hypothetical protein